MKKKGLLCLFAIMVFGIGALVVYAAPQVLFINTNFNLKSGQMYSRTALQAEYNAALAELTVDSVTSGERKNTFMVSRLENGKYVLKAALIQKITPYTCTRVDLGYIGHGNWMYSDAAGNPNTGEAWAGWAGTTQLSSY